MTVLIHAIQDGINQYVREVLIKDGLIEAADIDSNIKEDLEKRRKIAESVANKWLESWFEDDA